MKLDKLEMHNFRQYAGDQVLSFAKDDKKNITIILGENGKGKTGIFRALMYSLYGADHIQQDNKKEPVHLVNINAMKESNIPVDMYVKATFEHLGQKYEITRRRQGVRIRDRITEHDVDDGGVELLITDTEGNVLPEPITDVDTVQKRINDVLDTNIKNFFLFDGEKIDTLAKTNDSVKKEVRDAIQRLLQIDDLDQAIKIIQDEFRDEQREISNSTVNADLKITNDKIESKTQEITELSNRRPYYEKNSEIAQKSIDDNNLKLAENKKIHDIQVEIKNLKTQRGLLEDQKELNKKNVSNDLQKSIPFLLCNKMFSNVQNHLDNETTQTDSIISLTALQQSINSEKCACCGNDLAKHEENLDYVKALLKKYQPSESGEMAESIRLMIRNNKDNYTDDLKKIKDCLINITKVDSKIFECNDKISLKESTIDSQAAKSDEYDNILKNKDAAKQDKINAEASIKANDDKILNLKNEVDDLKSERDNYLKQDQDLAFNEKVVSLLQNLKNDANDIYANFTDSMREKLTSLTTETFNELIDNNNNLIENININKKFELEISQKNGVEFAQDVSQGQRQIVALSFIMALAQMAADDNDELTFPLFMDSPFNRLSFDNRKNLIEKIPDKTSQWILLLTDTELAEKEKMVFQGENRVGMFYRIRQDNVRNSVLTQEALN